MIENVTKRGYQQPTPIQMQAIPLMIHVSTCQTSLGFKPNDSYYLNIVFLAY